MAYVLIIDDDEDFANATATFLRQKGGYEVGIELDTESSVKSMEERRPDLVILDVMFPENSDAGFELARTMNLYNEKLKGIPILMLTAVNRKYPFGFGTRDIDDHWLPVHDFLDKPIDFDVLQNKVSELLEKTSSKADEKE